MSQNISFVPLLDGETVSSGNNLTNRFGGATQLTLNANVSHTTDPALVRNGDGAMLMDVNVPQWDQSIVITELGGYEPSATIYDTRDLTAYDALTLSIRNRTGASFTFRLEVKDYRDDNAHRASQLFTIGLADQWTDLAILLNPSASGWVTVGNPDFSRARQFALLVQADQGSAINGQVAIDEMRLVEPGGALDPATAPMQDLVARLAERQFHTLWGARDRDFGAVDTLASQGAILSMNTTASLVKMLPGAIGRGWVSRADADAFVQTMLNTLNTAMDNTQAAGDGGFLPPRYIDRVTLTSAAPFEESSIDSAFMFLALYQYKSQPTILYTLRNNIEGLLDRFNFAAFSSPAGWRMAWFNNTHTFSGATYDGYGGENWTISLAAHLAQVNHVDITTHFHANTQRVQDYLSDVSNEHLVHTLDIFRPPFVQWLLDLFVDTNDRGTDSYPVTALASNPFDNAVRYQSDVHAYYASIGRAELLQPDAGYSGSQYQQFSGYEDFGEPDVYMPWSAAFGLLGDPQGAEAAIRHSLQNNLHGPWGLSDSAIWQTDAPEPDSHPAVNDLWNVSLSTMAMLEYLYDDNQAFTDLPEVVSALDAVFPNAVLDGDLNKDGFVGLDDLDIVLNNWNRYVAPGSYFSGDPTGDGFVGLADLDEVLNHWNAGAPPAAAASAEATEATTSQSVVVTVEVQSEQTNASRRQNRAVRPSDPQPDASPVTEPRPTGSWLGGWLSQQTNHSPSRMAGLSPAHRSTQGVYQPVLGLWEPGEETEHDVPWALDRDL